MKCVVIIYFIMCLISCEKGNNENRPEHSSSVSSNSFLPAPNTTGQQDAIVRMKTDPDVRAYTLKAQEVFSKAYTIKDTGLRNALIKAQLSPHLEKISTKWSAFLKGRADRNEIIRGGIEAAFPRLPSPASTAGPCEDTRGQDVGKCNRTMAVEAGLCALTWSGGPAAFGTCLVVVGAKSFLCIANAEIAYKNCMKSIRANTLKDGYKLLDWTYYRTRGWTYTPGLKITTP